MAFLGFMTVREHRRVLAKADALIVGASEHLKGEEFKIGRTLPQRVALAVKFLADRDQHIRGLQIQNQTHVELGRAREKQFQRAIVERDALRAELATLKAERDGLLSERDILNEACNEAATTRDKATFELAFWKKHGQLRDPATGRLIPKAKPTDVFTATHSPKAQAARGGDVRRACDGTG